VIVLIYFPLQVDWVTSLHEDVNRIVNLYALVKGDNVWIADALKLYGDVLLHSGIL
jgi:hypothetical protein